MYTFELQPRSIKQKEGEVPSFPTRVEIIIGLAEPHLFGVGDGPLQVIIPGRDYRVIWDADVGRISGTMSPPLGHITLEADALEGHFILDAARLSFSFDCPEISTLASVAESLRLAIPAILSVYMRDAPTASSCVIKTGTAVLRSELLGSSEPILVVTDASYAGLISKALGHTSLLFEASNRRLLVAAHYLHKAQRLIAVGTSRWEFTAEVLLNLYKVVEVLFGRKRDDVRANLRAVGYTDDEIEGGAIALMLLRDELDVCHATIANFKSSQLASVYSFVTQASLFTRELVQRLIELAASGEWKPRPPERLVVAEKEEIQMARLIETIRAGESAREARERPDLGGTSGTTTPAPTPCT